MSDHATQLKFFEDLSGKRSVTGPEPNGNVTEPLERTLILSQLHIKTQIPAAGKAPYFLAVNEKLTARAIFQSKVV
jgi:hypothetical protein